MRCERIRFLGALLPALLAVQAAQALPDYYVDKNSTMSPHDGSDWDHAFLELSTAIATASSNSELWVAAWD